jgi:hypothetical protein
MNLCKQSQVPRKGISCEQYMYCLGISMTWDVDLYHTSAVIASRPYQLQHIIAVDIGVPC